jgi:hypothetical protein
MLQQPGQSLADDFLIIRDNQLDTHFRLLPERRMEVSPSKRKVVRWGTMIAATAEKAQ